MVEWHEDDETIWGIDPKYLMSTPPVIATGMLLGVQRILMCEMVRVLDEHLFNKDKLCVGCGVKDAI